MRERALRLGLNNDGQHGSRWQAVISISAKIGCSPQTLNNWIKKAEVDSGKCPGVSSEMAERIKALEPENRVLRQADDTLLSFTRAERVTMDVGFYYMANAGGRLLGTVLSGASYEFGGLGLLLGTATLFILLSAVAAGRLQVGG